MATDLIPAVSVELVKQINAAHQDCLDAYWQGLNHAKRCGDLLAIARQSIPPKGWAAWVEDNCDFCRMTAWRYLKIASEWKKVEPFVSGGRLSLRDALTLLGSSDEEADDEDPPVVEGELVDETPSELSPPPKPAALQAGDRCQVSKQGHLYNGQEVEVLERQSGFYVAKTPEGKEYPFLPTELRPVETEGAMAPPPAPDPKPTRTQRLEKLLERCLAIALPDDLEQAIRQELKLPNLT